MQAVIGKDGRLKELRPVSGPLELIAAAVGAVQQWRYKPHYFNDDRVDVETQIEVNLRLHR